MWKDYTQKDNQRLATAFQTIQGHKPGSRGISAVVDWQQYTGLLVTPTTELPCFRGHSR